MRLRQRSSNVQPSRTNLASTARSQLPVWFYWITVRCRCAALYSSDVHLFVTYARTRPVVSHMIMMLPAASARSMHILQDMH
jgi:hypothetical protein